MREKTLEAMGRLDTRKQYVDDPEWTTERALQLLGEVQRLGAAARRVLSSAVADVPLLVQFGQPLLAALEELKEALGEVT